MYSKQTRVLNHGVDRMVQRGGKEDEEGKTLELGMGWRTFYDISSCCWVGLGWRYGVTFADLGTQWKK